MNSSKQKLILLITVLILSLTSTKNQTRVQQTLSHLPHFSFSGGFFRQLLPTKNISILLDNLLKGYDRKLRPRFGGPPTIVEIDVEVRSMGQISEMDMTFSMDCYFRQSWVDERLAFSNTEEAFTLSLSVLERLWKPDTFIYNGKHSYTHLITTPNRFVRLHHSGKILYSSRLTIKATCPMHLEDFPMDTQRCPLKVGSLGYTTKDVLYRWNSERQLVIAADMKLSQFDLIAAPSGFENITRRTGTFSTLISSLYLRRHMGYFVIQVYAPCILINVLSWVAFWINREATSDRIALDEHSTLLASFYLQRHMGNFFIQVYGPCMLLVVLSWVSFWLNREATADRISLGVTTVLTMTFLGLEARKDLPKVPYSTALDLFVWISFGFIFATIIEFAFVHSFTKFGSGEVMLSDLDSEWEEEEEEEVLKEEEEVEDETRKGRGVNCEGVQMLNSRQYQCQRIDVNRCVYCDDRYNQHSSHCRCLGNAGEEPQSKDVLHSSLPRHIERNLSLFTTTSSTFQRNTDGQIGTNKILSIPVKEESVILREPEERKSRRKPLIRGQTLCVASSLVDKPQSAQELCPACNNRLTDSQFNGSSDVMKEEKRRKKKKSLCSTLASYCCKRCNIAKARKRVKESRVEEAKRRIPKDQQMNSVSNIDEASRVLFPLAFLLINSLYWYSYLSHSQRLLFNLEPPKYAPSPY